MANPITFKPIPVDPKQELQRRLDAAPAQHAEALLVAYDLLQTAHDNGTLDLVHGLIGGRDAIATQLSEGAKSPAALAAARNAIAIARILSTLPPDLLQSIAKSLQESHEQRAKEEEPPSLWQIFRRVRSKDSRRALSLLTNALTAVGRATKQSS